MAYITLGDFVTLPEEISDLLKQSSSQEGAGHCQCFLRMVTKDCHDNVPDSHFG